MIFYSSTFIYANKVIVKVSYEEKLVLSEACVSSLIMKFSSYYKGPPCINSKPHLCNIFHQTGYHLKALRAAGDFLICPCSSILNWLA